MSQARIFFRITKIDEAKHEVWGRASQEVVDKAKEIFDYETSVPYFKAWSEGFAKETDGKSLGNIRAMHGKSCAGKVIHLDCNDAEKAIDIGTKIVNDNEWKMVDEGCYTGFSVGGAYVKCWDDPTMPGIKRYTADPAEISLVDSPCVPTAKFFDVLKADGAIEQRVFKDRVQTLKKWEGEEICNTATAVRALQDIFWLLQGEMSEPGEPMEQISALRAAVANLKRFIASEIMEDNAKPAVMAMAASVEGLEKALNVMEQHAKPVPSNPPTAAGKGEGTMDLEKIATALGVTVEALEKGDFTGHPFRGNQYAGGSGSDKGHEASKAAHEASKTAHGASTKANHMAAAKAHQKAASAANKAGRTKTAEYHNQMATYHNGRASRFSKADDPIEREEISNEDHAALAKAHGMVADLSDDGVAHRLDAAATLVKSLGSSKDDCGENTVEKTITDNELQKALGTKTDELAKANEALAKAQAEVAALKKIRTLSPAEEAILDSYAKGGSKGDDATRTPGAQTLDLSKITDPLEMSKAINKMGQPFRS